MRRVPFIQNVAVCVLAASLCSCGDGDGKAGKTPEEINEVPIGYRGEARVNPFLAVERLAAKKGIPAESRRFMVPLPDSGTLIVPAEAVVGNGIANELKNWIRNGGHVIYLVSGGDSAMDDFPESPHRKWYSAKVNVDQALLEEFGISLTPDGPPVLRVTWEGKKYQFKLGKGPRINLSANPRPGGRPWTWAGPKTNKSAVLASLSFARGRLTVVADGKPWRNRFIGDGNNAELLWKLISERPSRSSEEGLTIVIGVGSSFWALLFKHGWMALLAMALVIAVWLWKNLTRFGPPLIVDEGHFREFADNVSVAGTFLWSKRRSDVLFDASRRRIGVALRRIHATLELDSPEAPAFLAGTSGVPEPRVAEALRTYGTKDAHAMVRLMRDLQTIEASL